MGLALSETFGSFNTLNLRMSEHFELAKRLNSYLLDFHRFQKSESVLFLLMCSSAKKYDLYKVFDGFKIKNTPEFNGEPFIITVTCAYTTPVGDPYANYDEFDFILDNKPLGTVDIEAEGAVVESVKEMTNRLRIN